MLEIIVEGIDGNFPGTQNYFLFGFSLISEEFRRFVITNCITCMLPFKKTLPVITTLAHFKRAGSHPGLNYRSIRRCPSLPGRILRFASISHEGAYGAIFQSLNELIRPC